MNNLYFKRVEEVHIDSILLLFKNVFKKKLSKTYYVNKYKVHEVYNSFIFIDKKINKPIAHVGYSIANFKYNKKIYKVAFRFSSMVNIKYQKKGLYKKLLKRSFEVLKKSNINCVICWPNKINIIGSSKHNNFIFLNKIYTYSKVFSGVKTFKINEFSKLKNCTNKNLLFLSNSFKNIDYTILKNNEYFLNRYFKLNIKKKYYFFIYKNNYIFFSIKSNLEINITDFLYFNNYYKSTFANFLVFFENCNIKINLWINPNNSKIHNLFLDNQFIRTNKSFNLGYYKLSNKNCLPKSFLNNYNYSMGDSDVF